MKEADTFHSKSIRTRITAHDEDVLRVGGAARRSLRFRAAGVPRAVCDRGSEGRHGGICGEAAGAVQEPVGCQPERGRIEQINQLLVEFVQTDSSKTKYPQNLL